MREPGKDERFTTAMGLRFATRISVEPCTRLECGCCSVYVRFHDEHGVIFAAAPMAPEVARAVADELIEAAAATEGLVAGHA